MMNAWKAFERLVAGQPGQLTPESSRAEPMAFNTWDGQHSTLEKEHENEAVEASRSNVLLGQGRGFRYVDRTDCVEGVR